MIVYLRVKQHYVRGCCTPPCSVHPPRALGQGTSRNVGSDVIRQKGNWSHTTRVSMLTAKFLVIGDWHYHFPRQLWESAPPVPLLILSAETSWPLNSFRMTKTAFLSHPPPLHCWARSFVPLVSLSCLSILSSSSVYSLFLASFFPIYVLFWVACTPLLSNVTLLFSLKFPFPWPKTLRHTALHGCAIIPERSQNILL